MTSMTNNPGGRCEERGNYLHVVIVALKITVHLMGNTIWGLISKEFYFWIFQSGPLLQK